MAINKSILLNTDSYKFSQFPQYPLGTTFVRSYIESRGGTWNQTVFFGLQMFNKEYLTVPFTQDDIDFAEMLALEHGEPFNRAGWEYILRVYGGRLPIRIKAVPEGLIIPVKNVLAVIENTDPNCGWLTSYVETPRSSQECFGDCLRSVNKLSHSGHLESSRCLIFFWLSHFFKCPHVIDFQRCVLYTTEVIKSA